jgi:hypothetical protein
VIVPADQSKASIVDTKVEPDPRAVLHADGQVSNQEDEATELAFQIACEDPTEKDHLASMNSRARARVNAAAAEFARAIVALSFTGIARLFLNRSYKKITERRGIVGRSERGTLALQRLLSSFLVRRVLGRRNLLRILGAGRREDDEANVTYSLKLAERRYRVGEGCSGFGHCGLVEAAAADSPTVRVLIGVQVSGQGEPVWCLKRFMRTQTGSWSALYSGYHSNAESALIDLYSEPSPTANRVKETPVEAARLNDTA